MLSPNALTSIFLFLAIALLIARFAIGRRIGSARTFRLLALSTVLVWGSYYWSVASTCAGLGCTEAEFRDMFGRWAFLIMNPVATIGIALLWFAYSARAAVRMVALPAILGATALLLSRLHSWRSPDTFVYSAQASDRWLLLGTMAATAFLLSLFLLVRSEGKTSR